MSFQANNFATQPCQRKMKKLIYLFLLLPFVSFSQLSGVQATTVFGGSATSGTNRAAIAIGEVFTGATINIDRATLGIVWRLGLTQPHWVQRFFGIQHY